MKKILAMLCMMIACVVLAGCGLGSNEKEALASPYYCIQKNNDGSVHRTIKYTITKDGDLYTVNDEDMTIYDEKPGVRKAVLKGTWNNENDVLHLPEGALQYRHLKFNLKDKTMTDGTNRTFKRLDNDEAIAELDKANQELEKKHKKMYWFMYKKEF